MFLLVPAATSMAATNVDFIPEEDIGEDGIRDAQLLVTSPDGDVANEISITRSDASVIVTDTAGVSAPGCEETSGTSATCPGPFIVWVAPDAR